jgi:hypothetical protein
MDTVGSCIKSDSIENIFIIAILTHSYPIFLK